MNMKIKYLIAILILFFIAQGVYISYQVLQLQEAVKLSEQILNQNKIQQSLEEEYRIQIAYWSKIYGLDLNKALAIVRAESDFKNICNSEGCKFGQGIFMFIQSSWDYTGMKMKQVNGDPMDPYLNIQRGIYLLATEGDQHWNQSKNIWFK